MGFGKGTGVSPSVNHRAVIAALDAEESEFGKGAAFSRAASHAWLEGLQPLRDLEKPEQWDDCTLHSRKYDSHICHRSGDSIKGQCPIHELRDWSETQETIPGSKSALADA